MDEKSKAAIEEAKEKLNTLIDKTLKFQKSEVSKIEFTAAMSEFSRICVSGDFARYRESFGRISGLIAEKDRFYFEICGSLNNSIIAALNLYSSGQYGEDLLFALGNTRTYLGLVEENHENLNKAVLEGT